MTPLSVTPRHKAAQARPSSPAEAAASLEGYRQSMRRFLDSFGRLPYATRATCPRPSSTAPGTRAQRRPRQ